MQIAKTEKHVQLNSYCFRKIKLISFTLKGNKNGYAGSSLYGGKAELHRTKCS